MHHSSLSPNLSPTAACFDALESADLFDGSPYVFIGHSVGCWVAVELAFLIRQRSGCIGPSRCFFSAMPAPSIPEHTRPWTPQSQLNEEKFKEECKSWSISPQVFAPDVWPSFSKMLRSDFRLFDECCFDDNEGPMDCPIDAFYGSEDARITKDLVAEWSAWTTATAGFSLNEIPGNHLWPLNNPKAKEIWLKSIVQQLRQMGA